MNIILTARNSELIDAWTRNCADLPAVSIYHGSILDLKCDAIVSPGNSFGFMDGGIDQLYSHHFGQHIQKRLQTLIRTRHHGELLVGNAEIIHTDNNTIPFLIAAPTMRVPMVLSQSESIHPYLAARAALLLIRQGCFATGHQAGQRISDTIKSLAFPGLGTGTGRITPEACARQMRAAIKAALLDQNPFPDSGSEAQKYHQKLLS